MQHPKVTFVIPAYNAAAYLAVAVNSILSQTVDDWELIIVDDCSKDDTLAMARDFADSDSRIRVLQTERQSGGAYIPRKLAIIKARGEFIAPLDSDDAIEPGYLQSLLAAVEIEEKMDICFPIMYSWDGHRSGSPYRHDSTLYGKVMSGRDMVKYTLDGWRIHCNGGVIRKDVYLKAFENINEDDIEVRSYIDEYLSRHLLFNARNVMVCDVKYLYRENPSSITHTTDLRAFGLLWNNSLLIPFIRSHYAEHSEERKLMERQNFHCYFDSLRMLGEATLSKEELRKVRSMQKLSRKNADLTILKNNVSHKYLALFLFPHRLGAFIFSRLAPDLSSKKKK